MYEDHWIELIEPEAPPFWTRWRIIYAIVAIIVIVTLLAMLLWPAIIALTQPPPPTVSPAPLPRV